MVRNAERDLGRLLRGLDPQLHPGPFVFTTTDQVPAGVTPVVTVVEEEGLTLVVPQDQADQAGLRYDYVAGWITLRVHSSLSAVGLTATITKELAASGLSCNVVAGFHHDHLFVPYAQATLAIVLLQQLSTAAGVG